LEDDSDEAASAMGVSEVSAPMALHSSSADEISAIFLVIFSEDFSAEDIQTDPARETTWS